MKVIGAVNNGKALDQVKNRVRKQIPQCVRSLEYVPSKKFTTVGWRDGVYASDRLTRTVNQYIKQANAGLEVVT